MIALSRTDVSRAIVSGDMVMGVVMRGDSI